MRAIRVRQLAPVTAASAATSIWLAALGLLTTPFLLHTLGSSVYAVFALITIMTAYLANFELGFGHATARFLARARAQDDRVFEEEILATSLLVFLCTGLAATAVALGGSSFLVKSFADFPASVQDDAVGAVRLGAVVLFFTFVSSFASAALQAYGRFRVIIGARLLFGTLSSASAVSVAAITEDVRAVLAAQALISIAVAVFLFAGVVRAAGVRLRPALHRRTFRVMGGFSVFILATGIAYQVMVQGPPTVLAGYVPSREVAVFAVPALVFQQLTILVTSASVSFMPFASAESVATDRTHLAAVFRSHLRLTTLVMGPIAGFLIVFSEPLLSAWLGSGFGSDAAGPMKLLAAAALVLALSAPPADVARGLGRPGWVFAFTIVGAAIGILTALLTVDDLEASGAALALLLGLALGTTPFLLAVAHLLLEQSALRILAALAGPIAAVLVVAGCFWVGGLLTAGLPGAVITGVVAGTAYVIAAYRLVLSDLERDTLSRAAGAGSPA